MSTSTTGEMAISKSSSTALRRDIDRKADAELVKEKLKSVNRRLTDIQKELEETRTMAETPHDCFKDETFQTIKETFASGSAQFEALHAKLDRGSRVKLLSVIGVVVGVVLASLSAVYSYARNETNWEYTANRVQTVETSVEDINKSVNGMTVSFKLMEQTNADMKKQLEQVSPENIEKAVFKGIKRAR